MPVPVGTGMTYSATKLTRAIRAIEAEVEASKSMLCQDALDQMRDATRAGLIVVAEVRDDLEAEEVSEPSGSLDDWHRPSGW